MAYFKKGDTCFVGIYPERTGIIKEVYSAPRGVQWYMVDVDGRERFCEERELSKTSAINRSEEMQKNLMLSMFNRLQPQSNKENTKEVHPPHYLCYDLSKIKLALLENPKKYSELCTEVNQMVASNEKVRKRTLWVIAYILPILAGIIFFFTDHPIIALTVAVAILTSLLPGFIYLILDKIIPECTEPISYRKDGWIWVRLTEQDKTNYAAYILEKDEYDHKTFTINWNDITYNDGEVEVALKNRGIVIRYSCDSKPYYAAYKSALQSQFGQVEVIAKDGKYIIVNPYVIEESILIIIRHLELLEKQRLARINALINSNPEILEARKNQATIIVTIKARKSDYLNHLLNHQVPGISVISTMECCAYATGTTDSYERAYVFAVMNSSGRYCVIYENANEDNASIVAKVDSEEKCYECVAAMVNYMRSHSVNKRETLRSTHNINGFAVRSINHDDIASWKSNITGDYFVRKTSKRRHRRWHRRY